MSSALIFGLDGASYHILDDLVRRGVMPALGRFIEEGTRAVLKSTVPPLTPIAWTSLATGRTPGNHGVLGFFQYDSAGSEALRIVSARENRCETLWSIVNRHGLRSGALNFPVHSPPPRIDGYVIPGWLPWKWLKRFSHPPGLMERLLNRIPGLDLKALAMDFEEEKKSIAGAEIDDYEGWISLHVRRDRQWFEVLRYQMIHNQSELVGIVFDGVDKLQHLLWPYLDPDLEPMSPSPNYLRIRSLCWDYFRQVDQFLSEAVSLADGGPVFVVSDHGFAGTRQILFINTWLEREGYLTWKPQMDVVADDCHELEPDFYQLSAFDMSRTNAFALTASSNGIHIVVRGQKGANGGVLPAEYQRYREQLKHALLTRCVDPETGAPLVAKVWTREEIFHGPAMELAPDLTLELRDHGFFSVRRGRRIVADRRQPMGTHHPAGVFIAKGPGIRAKASIDPVHLIDVAPTVLYHLGIPIPVDLEGRPLAEIFAGTRRGTDLSQRGAPTASSVSTPDDAEQFEDDPEILERLKALGYIE